MMKNKVTLVASVIILWGCSLDPSDSANSANEEKDAAGKSKELVIVESWYPEEMTSVQKDTIVMVDSAKYSISTILKTIDGKSIITYENEINDTLTIFKEREYGSELIIMKDDNELIRKVFRISDFQSNLSKEFLSSCNMSNLEFDSVNSDSLVFVFRFAVPETCWAEALRYTIALDGGVSIKNVTNIYYPDF